MSNFFAYLARLKYINRWSLMRSNSVENVAEHSFMVSVLSQCLCLIANEIYGENLDEKLVVSAAIYHDMSEVLTGDLPTPIKYFNEEFAQAYKTIEKASEQKLLAMLPTKLQSNYSEYFKIDKTSAEYKIVKMADKLAALIKCIEETKSGNNEFEMAKKTILHDIQKFDSPVIKYFTDNFLDSFSLTLDELKKN